MVIASCVVGSNLEVAGSVPKAVISEAILTELEPARSVSKNSVLAVNPSLAPAPAVAAKALAQPAQASPRQRVPQCGCRTPPRTTKSRNEPPGSASFMQIMTGRGRRGKLCCTQARPNGRITAPAGTPARLPKRKAPKHIAIAVCKS